MPKKKETRGGANNVKYKNAWERKRGRKEVSKKWSKEHTRCINVRYNIENDKDILDKLDSVDNKGDYIRQLIRKDLEENKA